MSYVFVFVIAVSSVSSMKSSAKDVVEKHIKNIRIIVKVFIDFIFNSYNIKIIMYGNLFGEFLCTNNDVEILQMIFVRIE